jgi:hypothetical protein
VPIPQALGALELFIYLVDSGKLDLACALVTLAPSCLL